jgi:hypothetical protein
LAQLPSRYRGSEELLSHLKANLSAEFGPLTLQAFKRDFLNVMQGIERKGNRQAGQEDWVHISQEGQDILSIIKRPLFQALVNYTGLPEEEIEALKANLAIACKQEGRK